MINVTNAVKQAYEHSTRQRDKIILNGTEYNIINVEYIDDVYIEGNVYGTAIARQLSFEIPRCNIENQEFEYLNGIEIDGTMQWISLGNFITQDVQEGEVSGIIKVEALDYMIKSNVVYESNLPYGSGNVKIYDVALEACQQIGITLAVNSLTNGNFVVDSNQFSEGTLVRQVIQAIAQISGSVAKIKSDNKLYFINPNQVASISKVFDDSNYYELDTKRYTHPINTVVLGMADIEGENVVMRDEQAVERDGEIRIVFNDNPFAYTEEKRTELITALFNSIKGFEYRSYELKGQALPYLETLDKVQLNISEYGESHLYDSYIFRLTYKSPNGLDSITEAPSIINAMVNYENVIGAQEIAKRTEVIVDKQNQTITGVISEVDGQNAKLTEMQQSINEISSQISDIADITTSDSTLTGVLEMESINESEPVKIVVRSIGPRISHLIVGQNTIVGNNTILRSRTLRFTNLTTEEVFDYVLPDNLYYYDNENYDTFTLEYEGQICQVEKKCKLQNGDIVLLDEPVTTNYPYPSINLTTGDYRIELVGFSGYIFARLMATNMYTEQFATKVEMTSAINQKADEINAGVSETLTNYVTETQMNSAINIAKNEINLNVNEVSTRTTTAQSTADNAVSKANNAQTSADTATTLANNAQSTANNATTLANNAQNTANSINSNLTTNYFTKTETNSAINQKANQITSTVSENYSTKAETLQAKNDAISTANANTTQVLQSYSTTEQMNSAINQKANEITTSVNQVSSRTTTAQNTANSAVSKADNAQDTADDALSKANTAQSTADTATTKATNAQSTADSATTKANNAQSTANTATTKADNAQSTANTANTKAENAQTTANTATTKADNAQTSADNAQTSANNALQDIQDTNNAITGINENIDDINAQITDLVEQTTTYSTKSELQQTAESFEASITQTTETLTRSINGTQSEISEIKNYIHYDIQDTTGTLTLGKTDNPYTLQLTNHELKINENDNTVAYFDEDSMQVTNGVFNTSLAIGNFEFRPETNGSLSFTRRLS